MRVRILSTGGNVSTNSLNWSTGLKHIDAGGTHEESPYGGVPMGQDAEGTPNLVEENEVIYNDYVYSDRLKISKIYKPQKGKQYQQWEKTLRQYAGKSYAEAIKQAEKDAGLDERPNDPIAKKGFESIAETLAQAQEWQRDIEENDEKSQYLRTISPEEYAKQKEEQEAQEQAAQEQAQMQAQQQQQQMSMEQQQAMQDPNMQAQEQQQAIDPQMQAQMQAQVQPQMAAQGGSIYAAGGEIPIDANQVAPTETPIESDQVPMEESAEGAQAMEEAPHEEQTMFNAGIPAQEMSTSQLNETIDEIIQYARDTKDRQLLKEARQAKRGSRDAKEAFVDDAREDIQMAISEQKAAQQEQDQAVQEEQATMEQQQAAEMQAAQANAGEELNAQMQVNPQQMAAMMQGQAFADGGDLKNTGGGNYTNGVKTYGGEPNTNASHWYDKVALSTAPTLGGLYGYSLDDKGNLVKGEVLKPGSKKVYGEGRYDVSETATEALAKAIHENPEYQQRTAAYIADLEKAAASPEDFQKMLQSAGLQWAIETDKLRGAGHKANLLQYDENGNPIGIKDKWYPKGKGYDKKAGKEYTNVKDYVTALRTKDPSAAHNDLDTGTRYIAIDAGYHPLKDSNGNLIYLDGQQVKDAPQQYRIVNDLAPHIEGRWEDYYVTAAKTPAETPAQNNTGGGEASVPEPEVSAKQDTTPENAEDLFPKRAIWGDIAKVAAQTGAAIHNIITPPDYTHANAIESAANRPIRYVGFNPVGIRQAYNPADPFFLSHQGMAQNRATAQDLLNIGNGNQNAIAGNLIMNNYQGQLAQGQNYYTAHQQNTAQQLAANQFNAQQEQFNSNGLFNAGRANQDAYNSAQKQRYDAAVKASAMRQSIDDAKAKAISSGLSGIVNGVGTIFDNDYNNRLLGWKLNHNYNPISQLEGYQTPSPKTKAETTAAKAKGGGIKRNKYRGFNL